MICYAQLSLAELKEVCGSTLKIYCFIKAICAYDGKYKYTSGKTIAHYTGLSRATVHKSISELAERGVISKSKTRIGGFKWRNRYLVSKPNGSDARYCRFDIRLLRLMTASQLAAYAALLIHSDRRGYAYPSERQIARDTGLSSVAVHHALIWLDDNAYITRSNRSYKDTCAYRSCEYYILPLPEEAAEELTPLIAGTDAEEDVREKSFNGMRSFRKKPRGMIAAIRRRIVSACSQSGVLIFLTSLINHKRKRYFYLIINALRR